MRADIRSLHIDKVLEEMEMSRLKRDGVDIDYMFKNHKDRDDFYRDHDEIDIVPYDHVYDEDGYALNY